jgi:hypothetical protein
MLNPSRLITGLLLAIGFLASSTDALAFDFDKFVKPLLSARCVKCHDEKKANGKVNFQQLKTAKDLLAKPGLIKDMIEAVDTNYMPPEKEPALSEKDRVQLLAELKDMLRQSAKGMPANQPQIRRLNRFQYNNAVRDLFSLNRDVFRLPEKLMTRNGNYLNSQPDKMPDTVDVACLALNENGGLAKVDSYPKDLRAAHGFDNQANQLTLSPLLLDSFLKLSVSILESPDFNPSTVGIWNDFFKAPAADADIKLEIAKRLTPFLEKAFRDTVDPLTLTRYVNYAASKIKQGATFTDGMKKVASAVLSSPMFLYRYRANLEDDHFGLASNLSFFLWGSGPDAELLRLAKSGELSQPKILNKTIDRMMADSKIERFLDTFPAQWMQLENILAATPDPKKYRLFSLDKQNPAATQMVLEPLLLFDAVFIEERPIVELISPSFSYQSEFLKTWYTSDLKPPKIDIRQVTEFNRIRAEKLKALETQLRVSQGQLDDLIKPIRERILEAKKKETGTKKPVDLKPFAAWEFNGDLKDSIKSLHLKAHGKIHYKDGMVVLNRSFLQSSNLPIDLEAKTMEVWLVLDDVGQRGGGAMTIQGPGDFFDSIVLGERQPQHWISGSNGFARTLDFPGSVPEQKTKELVQLTMVYQADGTTLLYRNGQPYGKPFRKGSATFPKNRTSVLFGLRHVPAGGNKFLSMSVDKARLYDRALTAAEVAASYSGDNFFVSNEDLEKALSPAQKTQRIGLVKTIEQANAAVKVIPKPQDIGKMQQDAVRNFENGIRNQLRSRVFKRVASSDPRYGGVITNAATLTMTSSPKRTLPIARGAWVIEVIFNDPPPPPPKDVPPLDEEASSKKLTIREKFAQHRENPNCAGCHSRLDPLGFALENFDITGRWRDKYENNRNVDSSGTLMKKYDFKDIVDFKKSLVKENRRFAKAFTAHMLRFALCRELSPADSLTVDEIVSKTKKDGHTIKSIVREVILCTPFRQAS